MPVAKVTMIANRNTRRSGVVLMDERRNARRQVSKRVSRDRLERQQREEGAHHAASHREQQTFHKQLPD